MKLLLICVVVAGVAVLLSFAQSGIFGKWRTIDDENGKLQVRVYIAFFLRTRTWLKVS